MEDVINKILERKLLQIKWDGGIARQTITAVPKFQTFCFEKN